MTGIHSVHTRRRPIRAWVAANYSRALLASFAVVAITVCVGVLVQHLLTRSP